VTKNVTAPAWVVLIGAVGLVIGLATYGYKVGATCPLLGGLEVLLYLMMESRQQQQCSC
jgi:hypothetical protein